MAVDAVTDPVLSIEDAYAAMVHFLDAYWQRGEESSDDIAILLGGMAPGPNGRPGDPGVFGDWLDSVRAITGKGPQPL